MLVHPTEEKSEIKLKKKKKKAKSAKAEQVKSNILDILNNFFKLKIIYQELRGLEAEVDREDVSDAIDMDSFTEFKKTYLTEKPVVILEKVAKTSMPPCEIDMTEKLVFLKAKTSEPKKRNTKLGQAETERQEGNLEARKLKVRQYLRAF